MYCILHEEVKSKLNSREDKKKSTACTEEEKSVEDSCGQGVQGCKSGIGRTEKES